MIRNLKTGKIRIYTSSIFILLSFSLLLTSCALKKKDFVKQSFQKGNHTVNIIDKDAEGDYFSKKKLNHPHVFTESEIFNKLVSLKYKKISLFSKEKKVFSRELSKEISPLFANAFSKAGRNDIIEFKVKAPKGRIKGKVFINRRRINWIFDMIAGALYEKRDSRDYLDSWKLLLLKGQKYHGEKDIFGVQVAKNWIIYPVDKTWTDEKAKNIIYMDNSEPTKYQNFKENRLHQEEVEAQFRRLKNLKRKGLISEEEYKTRKKALLEKYF